MRYAEFRDQLEDALQEAGLCFHSVDRPVEAIEIANTVWRWKAYIYRTAPRSAEPFHISAEVSFDWSPFDAARAFTREEDLLTELFGRRKRPARTERRWKRVDLSLHASLPYGSTTPMPEGRVFGAWTASIEENVHAAFDEIEERNGRIAAVLGASGALEVQVHSKPDGILSLNSVAISGFRIVHLPRVWDDPERRGAEMSSQAELGRMARTFKATFDEWTKSVSELATWIRYSPPPPGAKPIEPWFDDQSEDDDGGPETIH